MPPLNPNRIPRVFTEEEINLLATSSEELEKRTAVMSFDIDQLVSRLKGEPWQQMLQGHLYFDHVITLLLTEELKNPNAIDVKRMGFAQKLQLVHAIGLIPDDMAPVATVVNKIRNGLAHDLEAKIGHKEIGWLKNALPKALKKEASEDEGNEEHWIRAVLVYSLVALDSVRQRNALQRLQQRKAYLNAARVLDQADLRYVP